MLNLTPHAIVIRTDMGDTVVPPSGDIARVTTVDTVVDTYKGIPVVSRQFGDVTGVPADVNQPILVSAIVMAALVGRPNTYAPDTGATAIRDDKGHIVAVTRLVAA